MVFGLFLCESVVINTLGLALIYQRIYTGTCARNAIRGSIVGKRPSLLEGRGLLFMHIKSKNSIVNRKVNTEKFLRRKPHYGYVYFLIDEDEIVYVGQTVKLPDRIKAHTNKRYPLFYKQFTHFSTLKVRADRLKITEEVYIATFNPKYNIQKPITSIEELRRQATELYGYGQK